MAAQPDLKVTPGDQGLAVIGLRKSYRKRPVIRDVSMTLSRGEVVALLGPNGSGKTTCFYAIAGLVAIDGGQVILDGRQNGALIEDVFVKQSLLFRNLPETGQEQCDDNRHNAYEDEYFICAVFHNYCF